MNCPFTLLALSILLCIGWTEAFSSLNIFQEKHPIVIVPGIYSSKLSVRIKDPQSELAKCFGTDRLTIWMNSTILKDKRLFDCFIRTIQLNEANSEGLDFEVDGFGGVNTIANLGDFNEVATDYLSPLINPLKRFRFGPLYGAPYDFRYGAEYLRNKYFPKFTELIEKAYEKDQKKVVVLCHSMGCIVSYLYLRSQPQEFKDKHILRFVSLAGAFGGSVNAVLGLTYGYNFHLDLLDQESMMLGFRRAFLSQPSSYLTLPNPDIFPKDQAVAKYKSKTYTPSQLGEFFEAINFTSGVEMWNKYRMKEDVKVGPGVDTYCLNGVGKPTIETVTINDLSDLKKLPDVTEQSYGDGDAVVNAISMATCTHWVHNNAGHRVEHTVYQANHMSILANPKVQLYLANVALFTAGINNITLTRHFF